MEQLEQIKSAIQQLKALRGSEGWTEAHEQKLLNLLQAYEKLSSQGQGGAEKASPSTRGGRRGSRLSSAEQSQLDSLIARGVPEEEAMKAVGGDSFYQSDKQMFDPKTIPEVNELEEVWNSLPPEQQNSFLAQSPWVAGTASFIDNLLPVSFLWALPDEYEAQVRNAIKENKGTADKAAIAGTILGLIGGPAGAASIARAGIKIIRTGATRSAGHLSAKALKEYSDRAKKLLKELEADGIYGGAAVPKALTDKIQKEINDVDDLSKDWYSMIYEQKWSPDRQRNLIQERINGLPDNHIIKQIADGPDGDDLMSTILDVQPKGTGAPTSWTDRVKKFVSHRAKTISLNAIPEGVEFAAALGADAGVNFTYSYNDWKSQGLSNDEAFVLALKYTIDRTPVDVLVEALDTFFGSGKGIKVVQAVARGATLLPDLSAETGQVRPDVYGYEGYSQQDFLNEAQTNNQGGPVLSPKTKFYLNSGGKVGDKIKLLMSEGKPQDQAVAIALDYKRRGKL